MTPEQKQQIRQDLRAIEDRTSIPGCVIFNAGSFDSVFAQSLDAAPEAEKAPAKYGFPLAPPGDPAHIEAPACECQTRKALELAARWIPIAEFKKTDVTEGRLVLLLPASGAPRLLQQLSEMNGHDFKDAEETYYAAHLFTHWMPMPAEPGSADDDLIAAALSAPCPCAGQLIEEARDNAAAVNLACDQRDKAIAERDALRAEHESAGKRWAAAFLENDSLRAKVETLTAALLPFAEAETKCSDWNRTHPEMAHDPALPYEYVNHLHFRNARAALKEGK